MSDTTLALGDANPDINLVVKAVEQFCAFEVLVGASSLFIRLCSNTTILLSKSSPVGGLLIRV